MRAVYLIALILALALAPPAQAALTLIERVTTTAPTQVVTSKLPFGVPITIQCDGPAYYLFGASPSVTVTVTTGFYLPNAWIPREEETGGLLYIAFLAGAGTVNCNVFRYSY